MGVESGTSWTRPESNAVGNFMTGSLFDGGWGIVTRRGARDVRRGACGAGEAERATHRSKLKSALLQMRKIEKNWPLAGGRH